MLASPYRRLSMLALPILRPQTIRDSAGSMQSLHWRCLFLEPCIETPQSAAANWLPRIRGIIEMAPPRLPLLQYLQSTADYAVSSDASHPDSAAWRGREC